MIYEKRYTKFLVLVGYDERYKEEAEACLASIQMNCSLDDSEVQFQLFNHADVRREGLFHQVWNYFTRRKKPEYIAFSGSKKEDRLDYNFKYIKYVVPHYVLKTWYPTWKGYILYVDGNHLVKGDVKELFDKAVLFKEEHSIWAFHDGPKPNPKSRREYTFTDRMLIFNTYSPMSYEMRAINASIKKIKTLRLFAWVTNSFREIIEEIGKIPPEWSVILDSKEKHLPEFKDAKAVQLINGGPFRDKKCPVKDWWLDEYYCYVKDILPKLIEKIQ